MLGPPEGYRINRSRQTKNNQCCTDQQPNLKSNVTEKRVQSWIWGEQTFGYRKELREDGESNSLIPEEDENRSVQHGVDIEGDVADSSGSGQQPQSQNGAHQNQ